MLAKPFWICLVFCACFSQEVLASRQVTIYGTEQAKAIKGQNGTEYVLQMGSFKNKRYAEQYRQALSEKTTDAVHIKYSAQSSVAYIVYLGPYQSASDLKHAARQLAGEVKTREISPIAVMPNLEVKSLLVSKNPWVATLSIGPVWESAGQEQTFYLTPSIERTYTADNILNTVVYGEFFLGKHKNLSQKVAGHLGVTVATTGNATISGDIWDDADSAFNNFTYSYQVRHTHVAVKGKLIADRQAKTQPWVAGSLGVGFNQAHGFSNTPTISEALVIPNFADHTTTALTYTLSVGADRNINKKYRAGVAYQFADWGKSELARAQGQTVNNGLKLSHVYTNGFLINLSYHL